MNEFLGLPEIASAHGASLDNVNSYVHWLMFVLFVLWSALFVYMLFRFSRKRNPKADYRGVKSHASNYAEAGVLIAEVILLVGFSIPLYSDRVDDLPAEEEATLARVVAQQFAWNVHYPGPDGVFGRTDPALVDETANPIGLDREDPMAKDDVTTINQLYLPVNKPALIYLTSKDVIHSFMLPEMRVKQDAIPGMLFPVWFEPTVTTAEMQARKGDASFGYQIACAQLCGNSHYSMRGFMTIQTQEEFDAWMAERQQELAADEEVDDVWG
jgi:cytochrome c oxidase subunit 2